MSAPNPVYTSEEERREAAELAGEPSDEERETALRSEAHHGRETKYAASPSPLGGGVPPTGEQAVAEGTRGEQARAAPLHRWFACRHATTTQDKRSWLLRCV
jgi:hypothetical protein